MIAKGQTFTSNNKSPDNYLRAGNPKIVWQESLLQELSSTGCSHRYLGTKTHKIYSLIKKQI